MSEARNVSDVQLAPSSDAATWTSGFHPAAHKTSAAPAMTPAMATPIPTTPPKSGRKPVFTAAFPVFVASDAAADKEDATLEIELEMEERGFVLVDVGPDVPVVEASVAESVAPLERLDMMPLAVEKNVDCQRTSRRQEMDEGRMETT